MDLNGVKVTFDEFARNQDKYLRIVKDEGLVFIMNSENDESDGVVIMDFDLYLEVQKTLDYEHYQELLKLK